MQLLNSFTVKNGVFQNIPGALDSGLNNGVDIWTKILIARGQRSRQITQQQVLT